MIEKHIIELQLQIMVRHVIQKIVAKHDGETEDVMLLLVNQLR